MNTGQLSCEIREWDANDKDCGLSLDGQPKYSVPHVTGDFDMAPGNHHHQRKTDIGKERKGWALQRHFFQAALAENHTDQDLADRDGHTETLRQGKERPSQPYCKYPRQCEHVASLRARSTAWGIFALRREFLEPSGPLGQIPGAATLTLSEYLKPLEDIVHRKFVALGAALVLAAGLGAAPAQAGVAKTHVVKVVAKAGGSCTKVGAGVTIKKVAYVCTKNTKTKKLTWVKKVVKKVVAKKASALSPECVDMKSSYVKMKSSYDSALAQIADTETKIAVITGPSGDALRAQVASLKSMILILGPTVSNALAQFNTFC